MKPFIYVNLEFLKSYVSLVICIVLFIISLTFFVVRIVRSKQSAPYSKIRKIKFFYLQLFSVILLLYFVTYSILLINEIVPSYIVYPSYSLMFITGFIVGFGIILLRCERYGLKKINILDMFVGIFVSTIVGMRLFSLIFEKPDVFFKNPLSLFTNEPAGLVAYGGIILSILFLILYCIIKKLSIGKVFDLVAPSVALGLAIGRVGCFLAGCCWGKLASPNNPLAISWRSFDSLSPVFRFYNNYLKGSNSIESCCIYPTQLFHCFSNLLIFIVLFLLSFNKKLKFDGFLFILFLLLYSITRFSIEFFRFDTPKNFLGYFTAAQFTGIFVFSFALILLIINLHRKRQNN